jgi:leucyl-tRNA synthetase
VQPYRSADVESAAQAHWTSRQAFRVDESSTKPKYFCVSMLPYPSGKLHMGHVRNYTINDMMYRYLRMNGYNVLMPMGWDAFGLPAENAAMKNRVAPAKWTYENIAYMKRQCQAMGWAIDWSREFATCQPSYYHWNQWFFLKMLEKGIAYRKSGMVNWDPVDQTVLANEQVIDGKGWRSGAPVEKREIPMYYLGITQYAEELLSCLDRMPGWPDNVKLMQANWIGKSVGSRFAFKHDIAGEDGRLIGDGRLYVFTTRADTIMGVTFCAVAAEHPLAMHAATNNAELTAFIDECRHGSVIEADFATMEKKGMATGLSVTHPLTGEAVPLWVGNYVLMSYGEGAVMGVPAHDERDFEFANRYGLGVKQVIVPVEGLRIARELARDDLSPTERANWVAAATGFVFSAANWRDWYTSKDGVCINSGKYDGLDHRAAIEAIAADLKAMGLGDKQTTYRLRDWGISRQRYWGTPIPIIHCDTHGAVPVPEADLPVVLPEDCVPDGSGNPLVARADFVNCACPICGQPSRRETDTMDTFVDSSWYYMRYASPDAPTMIDSRNDYWNPMDQYIGGITHAILHLLYARFWTKVMRDMGMVKFDEPFTRLLTQGMVLNHIYFRRTAKGGIDYFAPDTVEVMHDDGGRVIGAKLIADGQPVDYGGVGTMSKSRLNGVDPQDIIDRYGADAARLFVMAGSPPEQTMEWSDAGVEGMNRFLKRLWAYATTRGAAYVTQVSGAAFKRVADWKKEDKDVRDFRHLTHSILSQANFDYGRIQYNTVVSAGMKMLNALGDFGDGATTRASDAEAQAAVETLSIMLRMMNPVIPHITHVLWQDLGFEARDGDLLDAAWPRVDAAALEQDEIEMVLQINGKLRGKLMIGAGADTASIQAAAVASPQVQRFIAEHGNGVGDAAFGTPKVIVVPKRLVNVVLAAKAP